MKNFRDLFVWQKSKELVKLVYVASSDFPKEEMYVLTSQIRRCAISVPSNIAEGYGRNLNSDFVRFLRIASGSLYELQTQMDIAYELEYVEDIAYRKILDVAVETEKMLCGLIRRLKEN